MILEERVYTFYPGKIPLFFRAYEAGPRALQSRILGGLVGYFTSEFGTQNQTVHLWRYDDLKDRAARRAALAAEPDWQSFLAEVLLYIQTQESRILTPTAFSPLGAPVPQTAA
jgi:hypothetical protein